VSKKAEEQSTSAGSKARSKTRARTKSSSKARRARSAGGRKDQPSAIREWVKTFLIAAVLFIVMRSFLVQTFVITSGSMENTLLVGDYLIVNRAAIGSRIPKTNIRIPGYSEPHRWDVLVFDPPHEPTLKLVKRLVGMPGDVIQMRDKVLYLNGEAVEEPYVQHEDDADERHPWMEWQAEFVAVGVDATSYRPTRDNWGPLQIPEDRFFMLGDSRDTSLDSRYWGFLEGWRFEGRASRIYYSFDSESMKPFPFIRAVRAQRIGSAIR